MTLAGYCGGCYEEEGEAMSELSRLESRIERLEDRTEIKLMRSSESSDGRTTWHHYHNFDLNQVLLFLVREFGYELGYTDSCTRLELISLDEGGEE